VPLNTTVKAAGIVGLIAIALVIILKPPAEAVTIYSNVLDENRTILVHLPKDYQRSGKSYPVLYHLDGGDVKLYSGDIPPFTQAVDLLDTADRRNIPEMILIGIANRDRSRDMLPLLTELYSSGGGADNFLAFLRDELIPYVDKNFRTTSFRILYGLSDSGLFTIYALLDSPGTFSAYIASSPSLGLAEHLLYKKMNAHSGSRNLSGKTLYIPYCRKENPICTSVVPGFARRLAMMAIPGFRLEVKITEERCHVPKPGLKDGLTYVFYE